MDYVYPWHQDNCPKNSYDDVWVEGFPDHTIISPLFTGWSNFIQMPKYSYYKVFYVMRHPKDVIVSAYHSWMKTHRTYPGSAVEKFREENRDKGKNDILKQIIRDFSKKQFGSMMDWWAYHRINDDIMLVKFEDLIGENRVKVFTEVFSHCGAQIPEQTVEQFLQGYTLEKMRVISNNPGHYRLGKAGTWVDDWSEEVETFWNQVEVFQSPAFKALPYAEI
ncbi:MAG: hypothetical protein BWK79_11215 [Beggiatoa sp. IS2]|nr:MAG: hypothetical protein BWK79_11215 [Beggiatoa sp. IS2]